MQPNRLVHNPNSLQNTTSSFAVAKGIILTAEDKGLKAENLTHSPHCFTDCLMPAPYLLNYIGQT